MSPMSSAFGILDDACWIHSWSLCWQVAPGQSALMALWPERVKLATWLLLLLCLFAAKMPTAFLHGRLFQDIQFLPWSQPTMGWVHASNACRFCPSDEKVAFQLLVKKVHWDATEIFMNPCKDNTGFSPFIQAGQFPPFSMLSLWEKSFITCHVNSFLLWT